MARERLSEEQVMCEIERLKKSDAVRLARAEYRLKYRRRKYLYDLRFLEKRGLELMAQGITVDNIEAELEAVEMKLQEMCEGGDGR